VDRQSVRVDGRLDELAMLVSPLDRSGRRNSSLLGTTFGLVLECDQRSR
jgi:hypothetical protein